MPKRETRGRKSMLPEFRKSRNVTVRITEKNYTLLKNRYGAMQIFFDICVNSESEEK